MIKVENVVTINKPVAEVFAYVNNPENSTKWQGGVEAVEYDDIDQKVGDQYTEVRKFMGREMKTKMEITALETNKKYAAKALSGPVLFDVTVLFEPEGGGTKMTTTVEGEPGGFFKLASGALEKQLASSLAEDGARLKEILEG